MKRLLLLSFWILAVCSISGAQEVPANCPPITIEGPAGIIAVGALATYSVAIGESPSADPVEIIWKVSAGQIKDGQGTKSIRIIQPDKGLLVSVEVRGLPAGCPSVADVYLTVHPPPSAEKISELRGSGASATFDIGPVVRALQDHPNNQLFIIATEVKGKNHHSFHKEASSILETLAGAGIPRDRVTLSNVDSEIELIQFWRVPPGAENPRCKECDEPTKVTDECPVISVLGPPGVPVPGESIEFAGKLSGAVPGNLTYRWIVEGADVLEGQGTLRVKVRVPQIYSTNIAATLEVDGLPSGCRNVEAVSVAVCDCGNPVLLDEYSRLPWRDETARIDSSIAGLREYPAFRMIVIEYFVPRTSRTRINKRVKSLTDQLAQRHKLAAGKFQIVTADSADGVARTKIYIVPPYIENPTP